MLSGLAGLTILFGIGLLIAANWQSINDELKIALHFIVNLAVLYTFTRFANSASWWRDLLLTLSWGLVLTLLALIGQTYHLPGTFGGLLLTWLIITTPMLLAFAKQPYVVKALFIAFIVMLHSTEKEIWDPLNTMHLDYAFGALLPWLFLVIGCAIKAAGTNLWLRTSAFLGGLAVLIHATAAQIFWRDFSRSIENWLSDEKGQVLLTTLIVGFIAFAASKSIIKNFQIKNGIVFAIVAVLSVLFPALPLLVPHGDFAAVGALAFCIYVLMIAVFAHLEGWQLLCRLAILAVAIRVFIVYLELFSRMAGTGLGLVVSGSFLLVLLYAVPKTWAYLDRLRERGG